MAHRRPVGRHVVLDNQAAERAAVRGGPVEILTSDPSDMAALAVYLEGRFEIRRL